MKATNETPRSLTVTETLVAIAAVLFIVVPLGAPTAVFGWRWMARHVHERDAVRRRTLVLAIASLVLLVVCIVPYGQAWVTVFDGVIGTADSFDVGLSLVSMVPFAAMLGFLVGMHARTVWFLLRSRHPIHGRRIAETEATRVRGLRADLDRRPEPVPLLADGKPVLGVRLDGVGDSSWRVDDYTVLVPSIAHLVAIGQSGSGKSESILRLAAAHLEAGWRVVCIDAKEDHDIASRFRRLAIAAGIDPSRALTWPTFGAMDLFRGDAHSLADRIMACAAWTEPFYRAVASTVLLLACTDPIGVPTSMQDLVARLDATSLKARWAGTEHAPIASDVKASDIQGVRYRYFELGSHLHSIGAIAPTGGGWSWEDVDAAWITLPTSTRPGASAAFGRALLVDLISYLRDPHRRTDDRPLLLIVEELGAIVSADPETAGLVIEAVERARSAKVRAVLSVQTPEGLGDVDARARILHGGAAVLAHRMPQPDMIADLCGTTYGHEASLGITSDGELLDHGSVREQHQYRLPPGRLRDLPTGQAILINHGGWSQVAVPMMPE